FYNLREKSYYLPIRFATSIDTMVATSVIMLVLTFVFLVNAISFQKQLTEYESDYANYQQMIEDDDYANVKQLYDEETVKWKVSLGFSIVIAVGTAISFFAKMKKVEDDDENTDGVGGDNENTDGFEEI
ncbi:MAG: hypothetical protein MJ193_01750, partial [Clostridia bacterium]|nr:hypothetical protein [Clostridia bacterium]